MRKALAIVVRLLIFALVVLAGFLAMKTMAFSSKQVPIEPVELPEAPEGATRRLAEAVALPTVSEENGVDTAAFRQLDTLIRRRFPLVDSLLEFTQVNSFSRLYRWAGQKAQLPPILLMGHLDVVPVEEPERWQIPPFEGKIHEGYIWGRGTLDDKIACLGLLEAVEALLAAGFVPDRTVYLAFGHDEEVSGKNGAQAIAAYLLDQKIRFDYILDEGALVLREAMVGLDRPLAMIGIAEKGYTTLRLTAQLAEGGHSSMPPRQTAVGVLSKAIVQLQENPFPGKIDGATAAMFQHVGPEMSAPYRVLFANLWLSGRLVRRILGNKPAGSALIRTTTAPTLIEGGVKDNVLPTSASATINFRILPGETVETVVKQVERTVADNRIKVEVVNRDFSQNPSAVSDIRSYGFQVVQKTIQQVFPQAVVAPSLVVGATDSRHYQGLSNHIYRFLPVEIENSDLSRFHGIDERVSEENYRRAIQFYRQLIENSSR